MKICVFGALKARQAHASADAFAPLLGPHTAVPTAMNGIPPRQGRNTNDRRGACVGTGTWPANATTRAVTAEIQRAGHSTLAAIAQEL